MLHANGQKPSAVAPTALIYISLGGFLTVCSGVWFLYLRNTEAASRGLYYICLALVLLGVGAMVIGVVLGWIAYRAHSVEIAQGEAKIGAIEKDTAVAHKV